MVPSYILPSCLNSLKLLQYFRESNISKIEWLIKFWDAREIKVFKVIEYEKRLWALHLDLSELDYPEEQLAIPIKWHMDRPPTVIESVILAKSTPINNIVNQVIKKVKHECLQR